MVASKYALVKPVAAARMLVDIVLVNRASLETWNLAASVVIADFVNVAAVVAVGAAGCVSLSEATPRSVLAFSIVLNAVWTALA